MAAAAEEKSPRTAMGWLAPVVVVAAVLVHALFLSSLATGVLDLLCNDSTHRLPRGMDFFAVYQKSHEYSLGSSLYLPVDRSEQVVPYCAPYYRYLPSWAWLFEATLGRFDPSTSYWVWVVVLEALLIMCFLVTARIAKTRGQRLGLLVIWFCFLPFYLELFTGQFTFAAASFLTLFLLAAEARSSVGRSAWLCMSVAVKHVGVLLLPALLLLPRRRTFVAVSAFVLAICAIYFSGRPDDLPLFLGSASFGTPERVHAGNLGLVALAANAARLLPDTMAPGESLVILGLAMAVLGTLVWLTWRYRSEHNVVPLCLLWLVGYFLAGPDVYEHHYTLLLPVFAVAWLRYPCGTVLFLYGWLAMPTPFWLFDLDHLPHQRFVEVEHLWWSREMHAQILIYHAWKAVPTIWLFGWLWTKLRPGSKVDAAPVSNRAHVHGSRPAGPLAAGGASGRT